MGVNEYEDWEYEPEEYEDEYEDEEYDPYDEGWDDFEDEDWDEDELDEDDETPDPFSEIEAIKEYLAERDDPYGLGDLDFEDPGTVEAVAAEAMEDESHPWHDLTMEMLGEGEDDLAAETLEIEEELGRELSDFELAAVAEGAEHEDGPLSAEESLEWLANKGLDNTELRREWVASHLDQTPNHYSSNDPTEYSEAQDADSGEPVEVANYDLDNDESRRAFIVARASGAEPAEVVEGGESEGAEEGMSEDE